MNRLLEILSSGDGYTTKTAYHVNEVMEEYAILNHYGLKLTAQFLETIDGRMYDKMQCKDNKGNKHTLYFDITEHMQRLSEQCKDDLT